MKNHQQNKPDTLKIMVVAFTIYTTTPTQLNAQEVGVRIDSVEVGFGDYDNGLGPAASRIGGYVWEIKADSTLGIKDTLDFGDVILYKRGDPNEYNLIYGGKQDLEVTGSGIDSAYTVAVGRIIAPDGSPRVNAGVTFYDAYSPISPWNHGDNLLNSYRDLDSSANSSGGIFHTDANGRFAKLLKIPIRKNAKIVSVETETISNLVPDGFGLLQNYPNPFNPSTTIEYTIPKGNENIRSVQLNIYNTLGKEVARFDNLPTKTGIHKVKWTPKNNLSSGTYFYKITNGKKIKVRKMLYLK